MLNLIMLCWDTPADIFVMRNVEGVPLIFFDEQAAFDFAKENVKQANWKVVEIW